MMLAKRIVSVLISVLMLVSVMPAQGVENADVNSDGKTDTADISLICKALLNME
ncbi:MAG: hypothetical protein K6G56_04565 [Clostridiales bacterium]|nr:hypothetical protein [Clostridiales bacterium]